MKSIIDVRDAKISEQAELIRRLQHNVEVFRRLAFGKSSERRPVQRSHEDPSQGHLFAAQLIEEAELVADCKGSRGHVEQKAAKKKRPGGRRKKFPEHLPVWRTDFGLPSEKMTCSCGSPLHAIGADVRRELERIEICIVHEIACQKYACRACEKVVMASGPDRVIEKGILGTGFLSSVLVERFGNHMPYHRLEKKYAAEGLDLSRSVLQRSMSKLGELFRPIYDQLGRDVLQSPVIFTDDTPVTVANHSNKNKSGQGRCWIYADREGRHFYDYTASRKRDGPARILGQYRGYIQADAYPGYDQLFLPEGATEVACWAHYPVSGIMSTSSVKASSVWA